MSISGATARNGSQLFLLLSGALLLVGGFVALLIARASITSVIDGGPMPTLPVGKFTTYSNSPMHSNALAYGLMPFLLGAAVLGLLMLVAALALRAKKPSAGA